MVTLIRSKEVQGQVRSFVGCVSDFSFVFKFCGCCQGAMGASYGTRAMGAHATKGLRKDVPERKKFRALSNLI